VLHDVPDFKRSLISIHTLSILNTNIGRFKIKEREKKENYALHETQVTWYFSNISHMGDG
jgi:hypothetical protein